MRLTRFATPLALLVTALAIAGHDQPPIQRQATSTPAVHVAATTAVSPPSAPLPTSHVPLDLLGFGLVGATTKKRTRRASGAKSSDVPLWLDSDVHVPLEDSDLKEWRSNAPPGQPGHGAAPQRIVQGGVLVDDTDLSDEQIEDLQRRGVIRPAKPGEVQAAEARVRAEERRDLEREQQNEMAALKARQDQQRADAVAKGTNADGIAKLNEKQTAELTKLQDEHVKALNAFDKKSE